MAIKLPLATTATPAPKQTVRVKVILAPTVTATLST